MDKVEVSIDMANYLEACELIDDLKAVGIEANITGGGVAIYIVESDAESLFEICKKYNKNLIFGMTTHQSEFLAKKRKK